MRKCARAQRRAPTWGQGQCEMRAMRTRCCVSTDEPQVGFGLVRFL